MKEMNFHDLCCIWLKYKSLTVKKTSLMQYDRIVSKYLEPILGSVNLEVLNIYQLLDCIETTKKDLTVKSVQDIIVVLKSILKYGNSMGLCSISLEMLPSMKLKKKEIEIFHFYELKQIEKYLINNINEKNLGIIICLHTGMRLGEICALEWSDVDLINKKIFIHKTIQRIRENGKSYTVVGLPKTDSSIRTIPIHEDLLKILFSYQYNEGYILTGTDHYLDPRSYQYYFQKVLRHLNIKAYKFHTLRHTFATRCVQCQVDIKSLSEILGHSNVSITLNTYVHSSFEMKKEEMKKFKLF